MSTLIAVLAGDGVGQEITQEAVRVLEALELDLEFKEAAVGGVAYEAHGHPLPKETIALAKQAQAVLFGAVGDWKYDELPRHLRPEQAILGLRKELGLFANLRPALLFSSLAEASSLKPEVVSGLDIMIVRELTGDIYFGEPSGVRTGQEGPFAGEQQGFDTMLYAQSEIRRIAHLAFQAAQKRQKKLCSVDKANVLETSQLWRYTVNEIRIDYTVEHISYRFDVD